MKTIAFAIVVAACLLTPERHDILFISSIAGLWTFALNEHEIGERRKKR